MKKFMVMAVLENNNNLEIIDFGMTEEEAYQKANDTLEDNSIDGLERVIVCQHGNFEYL